MPSPRGAGGAGARGRCAGWPTGWSCARAPGSSTPARAWAVRRAGSPPPAGGRRGRGGGRAGGRGWRRVWGEPMAAGVRASRRLFGLPSVVAVSQQLPFADASFDAAWCLGGLCTTSDKAPLLAELRRVLPPGARLGLLVFVADGPLPPPLPEGNKFPSEAQTRQLLAGAGFTLEETAEADLGDSPAEWTRRADAVEAEVARRHGTDPAFQQAEEQSRRVGRLLSDGALRGWLGVAMAGG